MAKRAVWAVAGALMLSAVARGQSADDHGRAAIGDLDWNSAIRIYEPLAAGAQQGSAEWTKYTFCLGVAYQQVQPPNDDTIGRAKSLFQSVVDHGSDKRYVARALLNLGRIAELKDFSADPIDLDGARKYYQQVAERFPDLPIAAEAVLREGAAFVLEYDAPDFAKVKQGVVLLEKYATAHPTDDFATLMWQTAGDAYFMPLDDAKDALRCYEMADKLGWADSGNQGPWYWRSAQLAEKLGEKELAVKYYTKIIKETPNSGKGYASVLALKKLGAPVPHSPLFDAPVPTTQEAPR